MMKEWLEEQGLSFWWKVALALVFVGTMYANVSSGFSDHETRTKEIEKAAIEQKKSTDQLAQDTRSTKEIMQQMLKVAKGTCLNTAKNDLARSLCLGD